MKPKTSFNKFAKGSYFLILDNLTNLGIGAIFWVVLAKIAEPGVIGQAMVITGFATIFIAFTGHGIQIGLSKYISEYDARNMPNTVRRLLRNGIKGGLMISAVLVVAISLLSGQISESAYQNESLALLLVFLIVTFVPTQTVMWVLIGAFQGMQEMKYVTATDLIFQLSRMGFAVFGVLYGLDVFGILLGFALASFLSLGVCYFYLLPRAIPKSTDQKESESKEGMKQVTRFTSFNYFEIGIKTFSVQLGILVLGTQSFEWAAFYGLALLISKIVGSFSRSVGMALLPAASVQLATGSKVELRNMVNTAVRISTMISGFGFIILVIDPTYFLNLISDKYVEAALALRILAASAIITAMASIFTSLLNASNRAKDVAKIGFISSMIGIALTLILPQFIGLEGAALAFLTSSIINLSLALLALKKEKITASSRSMIRPFVAIISGILVGQVFVFFNQILLGIIIAIVCYIGFCIAYRVTTRVEIKKLISIAVNKKTAE
ncbi:MAG: O-antigen/teichoic acid export membrane protein [Candidatus Nitrosomirales archaeon]|jgi:O-antigen/teichoic acid export membrane protein